MKRIGTIILAILLTLSLSACSSPSGAPNTAKPTDNANVQESTEPAAPALEGEGALGDYYVKILGVTTASDYEGKPAVVVTYNWTNNSDEAANFAFAIGSQVFQNDIECETAIIMDDAVYNADNYMKDIKPGASLDVQLAYVLQDATNPITVEISELISFDDFVISKDFDIA